jgi:glycosylphosphatidylinositol transamidase (GPIT) subunit GPI8
VEAPNIFMLSTSVVGESALADKTDGVLNTFLSDKFTGLFIDFLFQPNGYRAQQGFKLSEFLRLFTFEKVMSQLSFKSTSPRPLNEVLLSDFLPYSDEWLTSTV